MPQRPFILIIVTVLLTFVSSMSAYGQSADEEGVVYFRLVDTQIDTEYLSNRQNLKLIEELFAGRSGRIDSVTIAAWSSPEGSPRPFSGHCKSPAAQTGHIALQSGFPPPLIYPA